MRALRIHAWDGPLRLEDVPDPGPGPGEALVRVEACSIGLTVVNYVRGDLSQDPALLPRIPGHELIGRIVATGPGVDAGREGELVAAFFNLICGRCRACLRGEESMCENMAGFVGVQRDGGYAELVTLPVINLIRLPDGIKAVEATVVPDALATPVHVAGRARIGAGDRVVVVAAGGGVGIHMVQMAAICGAAVVGLDVVEEKLGYLEQELGVTAADSSNFAQVELPRAWGGSADVVVDLLGSRASLEWALSALAPGGRMVVLTTFRDVGFNVRPRDLVFPQATVMGSRYCSRHELDLAARLLLEGRIRPVISRRASLEEVEAVHDELRAGALLGRGALVLAQAPAASTPVPTSTKGAVPNANP